MTKTITVSAKKSVKNLNSRTFKERDEEITQMEQHSAHQVKMSKSSPFNRWTQLNNDKTMDLINLNQENPTAVNVLFFLVDQMDSVNAVICSNRVLMEVLGVSQSTITRAIKSLREKGFIAIYKSGASNVYAVTDKIFWKSWGSNLAYSKFPANVILTSSEQDAQTKINFDNPKVITLEDK